MRPIDRVAFVACSCLALALMAPRCQAPRLLNGHPDGGADAGPEPWLHERVRPRGDAVDVLIVLDNSQGTLEGQNQFLIAFQLVAESLLSPPAGTPRVSDLHVGLTNPDLGAGGYDSLVNCSSPLNGALRRTAHASEPPRWPCESAIALDPPWLEHSDLRPNDGGPDDPDGVPLWDDLRCLEHQADTSCEMEQPLESMLLALTDRIEDGTNAGFLRERALLVVLFGTEEDDCSCGDPTFFDPDRDDLIGLYWRCYAHQERLYPLDRYVALLAGLKPAGRAIAGGVISVPLDWSGDLEDLHVDPGIDWSDPDGEAVRANLTVCLPGFDGMHVKPYRLADFLLRLGDAGGIWSNCTQTFDRSAPEIAALIRSHLEPQACLSQRVAAGSSCSVRLLPLEPDEPCPEGTTPAADGACDLQAGQWELVETGTCTELRPAGGLELRPGAALEISCW